MRLVRNYILYSAWIVLGLVFLLVAFLPAMYILFML